MLIFVESNLTCRAQANNKFVLDEKIERNVCDIVKMTTMNLQTVKSRRRKNKTNWMNCRKSIIQLAFQQAPAYHFPFIACGCSDIVVVVSFCDAHSFQLAMRMHCFCVSLWIWSVAAASYVSENHFVGILIFACAWHSYVTATSLGPLLHQVLFFKKIGAIWGRMRRRRPHIHIRASCVR